MCDNPSSRSWDVIKKRSVRNAETVEHGALQGTVAEQVHGKLLWGVCVWYVVEGGALVYV